MLNKAKFSLSLIILFTLEIPYHHKWQTYDKKTFSSREGLHSSYGRYFFRASNSFFRTCTCPSKNNATIPTFLTGLSFPEVTRVLNRWRVIPSSYLPITSFNLSSHLLNHTKISTKTQSKLIIFLFRYAYLSFSSFFHGNILLQNSDERI